MSEHRELFARPLTAEAFRPFGEVIETDNASAIRLVDGGTATRFHDIAPIEAGNGRPVLSILRAKPFEEAVAIRTLGRDPSGTQALVPIGGHPFIVVVAPDEAGRPGAPVAFSCDGAAGISYAPGTWHHGLIALRTVSDFLVIDRDGADREEFTLAEPYWLAIPAR